MRVLDTSKQGYHSTAAHAKVQAAIHMHCHLKIEKARSL
jgi:hypothetical protein